MNKLMYWILGFVASTAMAAPVPGELECSWVGNTFAGAGNNGEGEWVQNYIEEMEVAPDGTVFTAAEWDEAGRCTGLYRDGKVNTNLIGENDRNGGHNAWGWGTAGKAVAVWGDRFYVVNTDGNLLEFAWEPGDLNSGKNVRKAAVGKAVGLSARDAIIVAVLEEGTVKILDRTTLSETRSFNVPSARDAAIAADGTLWILAGDLITQYKSDGTATGLSISDAGKPKSVTIAPDGRLVVCDDGPRQQVRIYDVAGKFLGTFGREGGMAAAHPPGTVSAGRFFSLRGAGIDAQGNIYVGMGLPGPSGNFILRSYSPAGQEKWQLSSHGFVDCFDFLPGSDGQVIYSVDSILRVDLSKPEGQGWQLAAMTVDKHRYPDDPRLKGNVCAAVMRLIEGRPVLYTFGQLGGGPDIYTFDQGAYQLAPEDGFPGVVPVLGASASPVGLKLPEEQAGRARDTSSIPLPTGSLIARFVGSFELPDSEAWAREVDANAGIWWADGSGNKLRYYPLMGVSPEGVPQYDRQTPQEFPLPQTFTQVCRVVYDVKTDSLYLSGYTNELPSKSWGLIGSVMAKYDGYLKGERKLAWTADLPVDDDQLHPKSVDYAGDYVFMAMVKSTNGVPAMVHVIDTQSGKFVGTMQPGPAVGGKSGWVDMTHGLRAMRRANGEYLILVEEGARGKNLLYRWTPSETPR